MKVGGWWLLAVAGCWRSAAAPPPLEHHTATEERGFVITPRGVGPFNARTVATAAALQKLVPRLRVLPHELGGESGIVYDIFDGAERLFYVVPDDAPGWTDDQGEHRYANTMFAVFAVSPRIEVRGRGWRVGSPFQDAAGIDVCECWGDREVTACYQRGSHIRVIFEQRCEQAESEGGTHMIGKNVDRIMWKRVVDIDGAAPEPDVPFTP